MRRPLLGLLIAVALAGLWVANCSGPQPGVVGEPRVTPPESPGEAYRVEAVVANRGPGHGQVEVVFRLEDPATGQAYEKDETVDLERGESLRVAVEILAPPAAYRPRVEARYPVGT